MGIYDFSFKARDLLPESFMISSFSKYTVASGNRSMLYTGITNIFLPFYAANASLR